MGLFRKGSSSKESDDARPAGIEPEQADTSLDRREQRKLARLRKHAAKAARKAEHEAEKARKAAQRVRDHGGPSEVATRNPASRSEEIPSPATADDPDRVLTKRDARRLKRLRKKAQKD